MSSDRFFESFLLQCGFSLDPFDFGHRQCVVLLEFIRLVYLTFELFKILLLALLSDLIGSLDHSFDFSLFHLALAFHERVALFQLIVEVFFGTAVFVAELLVFVFNFLVQFFVVVFDFQLVVLGLLLSKGLMLLFLLKFELLSLEL